jgi:predicted esterase YcpF (UPF0227 family)
MTRATTTHLLYLHGFRSSPQSMKAQKVAARMQAQHPGAVWWCPQLPPSPREAMELVMRGIQDWPRDTLAVAGSSLGGFYARWLALRTGCRSVLLNPAVFPARDLAKYIGEQTAWHDPQERFFFEPGFVGELQAQQDDIARLAPLHPATHGRQFAIVAKGTGARCRPSAPAARPACWRAATMRSATSTTTSTICSLSWACKSLSRPPWDNPAHAHPV